MASADLRKELKCSVCLNIYTDPVNLRCGHNFCRDCIGRVLDTQGESGGYSCPECREEFQERPALQRNITLRNIVENFLSAQPDQRKAGTFCTYCIHTLVPAVISCLLCEASLCDNHLRVHSKSPEHVLCDPTTSLENRKCSIHKELLKYYCTEDSTCICVSCSLAGEHRGHQVETLAEASEMKKRKVRDVLQKLMTEREKTEKRVQSLQEHRRKVQGKADDETERVTALFRDLEKRVLSDISGQAERVLKALEMKKDELYVKIRRIEELCNTTELTVLMELDASNLCDTEDGDDEDRERLGEVLHDGHGLDVAWMSHILHTGLSDILSERGTDTNVHPHSSTEKKASVAAESSRPHPQESDIGVSPQTQGLSGVPDLLLDVSTADNRLQISHDKKTWSDCSLSGPPERFQGCPQVMSSRSFSSGRHYWEVDVGGADCWLAVICSGHQSVVGYNKKSWSLGRLWDHRYSLMHDSNQIHLPNLISTNRVRIDLDYEAGRISFYDLCDPIQLLHTFTDTFTEPLHAAFSVWGGCIAISGGNEDGSDWWNTQ